VTIHSKAKRKRAAKPKSIYPGGTLNAQTTGIPASQWFQPKTTTSEDETNDVLGAVQSYQRHIELGLTPLVRVSELLADVEAQLEFKLRLEADWQDLRDEHDMLNEYLKEDKIARVIEHALTEHVTHSSKSDYDETKPYDVKGATKAAAKAVVELIHGFDPTEESK
jgi:hypothetical protein